MLILPIDNVDEAEARALRMTQAAMDNRDREGLLQLWCLVRSAESRQVQGDARDRLFRLRGRITDALAELAESGDKRKRASRHPRRGTDEFF